ncbi:recombinase family protein [Pseudarthrobacter sp. H2]|uniref:recombinase family protein n=1 Tax=Pseudarthrobacter sp. H2 TaxID=3418415 RepID=UPI003CF26310
MPGPPENYRAGDHCRTGHTEPGDDRAGDCGWDCRGPGLGEALAAVRAGDTLVITKLDRLARSLPDAKDIIEDLTRREAKLSIGGSVHDPTDPVGRLLFNVLAMVAEFESDLLRAHTREGMQVATAKGRLRGKQPKLTKSQEAHLVSLYRGGQHTTAEIAELFGAARSTVYRIAQKTT